MIVGRNGEQLKVRVTRQQRAALVLRAETNGRSVNSEIVQILDSALRSATATTGASFAGATPAVAPDKAALAGSPINQR